MEVEKGWGSRYRGYLGEGCNVLPSTIIHPAIMTTPTAPDVTPKFSNDNKSSTLGNTGLQGRVAQVRVEGSKVMVTTSYTLC